MTKTPEEYFAEQSFQVEAASGEDSLSPAEQAFLEKYLGMDAGRALSEMGMDTPSAEPESVFRGAVQTSGSPAAGSPDSDDGEPDDLDQTLRESEELQLVSFHVGAQEFAIPITMVQEVIRYMQPTKLPAAPYFLAGIVNLRGRVTPLVRLRDLLRIPEEKEDADRFIVVCRRKGLQMGLMIETVHTMYRVRQDQMEWGIENQLGGNVDYVSGLMKQDERLVGIVSVDRIVESVLKS